MKILLITEKFEPDETQRDGGARLISTLQNAFGNSLHIMQFGSNSSSKAAWHFDYPHQLENRFDRRLANADFIINKIKSVEHHFNHIIFVHISMQFGLVNVPLASNMKIITFPMFLTKSYQLSGEKVPENYFQVESAALKQSDLIITPSYLEKNQLMQVYAISEKKIRVIPRGVDNTHIQPCAKNLRDTLNCCSIGSIKRQKNTLDLIKLFSDISAEYQNATLQIIGPIQDHYYYKEVCEQIRYLNLDNEIIFRGYVAPKDISLFTQRSHLHLSTSTCETFGRSIFETLAAGIPNIVRLENNAAANFLSHLPYIRFVKNNMEALTAIKEILPDLPALSSLAAEIGKLYSDKLLSRLVAAEIYSANTIAISDFDGTLYHKYDAAKTQLSMDRFRQYPIRVVCSARRLEDLVDQLKLHGLDVHWIIACSGAVVADGQGKICWLTPLGIEHVAQLNTKFPDSKPVSLENNILQICASATSTPELLGLRTERYDCTAYISAWEASKLHAIIKLLNYLSFFGRVAVFGDGKYDLEMITFFDGTFISA